MNKSESEAEAILNELMLKPFTKRVKLQSVSLGSSTLKYDGLNGFN